MVPISLARSVHRMRSTLTLLMPPLWRARLMADVALAVSLGVRAEEPACINSKVRWSMVYCGPGVDSFLGALVVFLLWTVFHSPVGGVAATVANPRDNVCIVSPKSQE